MLAELDTAESCRLSNSKKFSIYYSEVGKNVRLRLYKCTRTRAHRKQLPIRDVKHQFLKSKVGHKHITGSFGIHEGTEATRAE